MPKIASSMGEAYLAVFAIESGGAESTGKMD
jgi:hypothetical protein